MFYVCWVVAGIGSFPPGVLGPLVTAMDTVWVQALRLSPRKQRQGLAESPMRVAFPTVFEGHLQWHKWEASANFVSSFAEHK